MNRLWQDTLNVLETAEQGEADIGVVIDRSGAIRIVEAAGWRPEALQGHYGAETVFQVSHGASSTRVMGRCGGRSCVVEADRQSRKGALLMDRMPLYTVLPPVNAPGEPRNTGRYLQP